MSWESCGASWRPSPAARARRRRSTPTPSPPSSARAQSCAERGGRTPQRDSAAAARVAICWFSAASPLASSDSASDRDGVHRSSVHGRGVCARNGCVRRMRRLQLQHGRGHHGRRRRRRERRSQVAREQRSGSDGEFHRNQRHQRASHQVGQRSTDLMCEESGRARSVCGTARLGARKHSGPLVCTRLRTPLAQQRATLEARQRQPQSRQCQGHAGLKHSRHSLVRKRCSSQRNL